jgi:hypothetical protein
VVIQQEQNATTYRIGTGVGLSIDRDLLNVAVGCSSRSQSQSRQSGDKRVLRERRVVHGDRLVVDKSTMSESIV